MPYGLILPGGLDEPGHRDIPPTVEAHPYVWQVTPTTASTRSSTTSATTTAPIPQGNPLHNLITEAQKQRAREVFAYYSHYLGVQFVETPDLGFTIVTGDLRRWTRPFNRPGRCHRLGRRHYCCAIMDNAENWGRASRAAAGSERRCTRSATCSGLATLTICRRDHHGGRRQPGGRTRSVVPGDHDIVHGRHCTGRRAPISTCSGSASIRRACSAPKRSPSGWAIPACWTASSGSTIAAGELIARNDDYFSEDSFVELELQPGDYYVAVTSTGMSEIDPRIAASGFGGTSEGRLRAAAELQAQPRADVRRRQRGLVDIDGQPTLLDGDADGNPGGEYNFWFTVRRRRPTLSSSIKSAPAGGNGSLASPFNNIPAAFAAATARNADGNPTNDVRVVRIVGNGGTDGNLARWPTTWPTRSASTAWARRWPTAPTCRCPRA